MQEAETGGEVVGPRAYRSTGTIMGMASTRNTGFARYAAISALVAIPRVMKKGNFAVRMGWGILLAASLYALLLANGRTETLAFVASLVVLLVAEKAKRTVNILVAIAAAILLGLRGFYSRFYFYITRGEGVDPTLTGRTQLWDRSWDLLWKSPWMGFGFQADRLYLGGWHMHNAFLHVLIQSGLVGGMAILLGLAIVWYYTIYYFYLHQPSDKSLIPAEIPAIFLFLTVSSITESTFAYFSACWLLSAPIVAYVMALHMRMRGISLQAAREQSLRARMVRRNSRGLGSPLEVPPPTPGRGIPD